MTAGTANKILKAMKCIEPDAYAAGAVNGPAIDCRQFGQALFILEAGTLGASATLDCKIQGSADGSTGWADITGAAFTQKTQAGGDSDKVWQGSVGCAGQERYLRAVMTVAVATSDCGVACVLADPQEAPVTPQETDDDFTVA